MTDTIDKSETENTNATNTVEEIKKRMLVNFSDVEQQGIGEIKKSSNLYSLEYDDDTNTYYRLHRINKTDPITYAKLTDKTCFKFKYMWDPYTGNRSKNEDPYGPLCFSPISLLTHFYKNRLNKLWIDETDEYMGTFSDGAGSGEDIEVPGRGIYPECYLFRLPVPNCYLKKNHNLINITMGPKLTNSEICEIDRLIVKHWSSDRAYNNIYNKIDSLYILKCYYDIAIAKKPTKMDLSNVYIGSLEEALEQECPDSYLNFRAIEIIRDMV